MGTGGYTPGHGATATAFMERRTLATTLIPGAHIRGRRLKAGLTQQSLAVRANVARSTLQEIEYGIYPHTDTYARLLNALEKAEGVFV